MADAKNSLVDLTDPQRDTYRVRGSDFSKTSVRAVDGAGGEHGEGMGPHNVLVGQTETQRKARHNADSGAGESGYGTPSVWGKEGEAFAVQKNKGEGSSPATDVAIAEGVDLVSGRIMAKGYSNTPVDEVEEQKVSLGKH
jgi:hypothetical protein